MSAPAYGTPEAEAWLAEQMKKEPADREPDTFKAFLDSAVEYADKEGLLEPDEKEELRMMLHEVAEEEGLL